MRKVYVLPNLFTAASLFCGMLAIIEVLNAEDLNLNRACLLILASAILDVFDGLVARLTRTQSAFGLHFDSLSDVVAFGVAPGVLVYGTSSATDPRLLGTVCCLFAVFGALRLARFNVQALKEEKKTFTGLPIPAAALTVMSLVWFMENHLTLKGWLISAGVPYDIILPLVVVVIAFLMVSKLPFYGFKSISLARRQPFELLVISVLIAGMLYMLRAHLDTLLFVLMWTYVLVSILGGLRRREAAQLGEAQPAGNAPPNDTP